MILAKYFSRRHVEIAIIKNIVVSFLYCGLIVLLLIMQPDFGSAMIVMLVWLGMIILMGAPKKYLLSMFLIGITALSCMWFFVFADYQKQRIITFIDPYTDITGSGYNVYQSLVAVGSGSLMGKGVGEGTQSRLSFLPESETDFIFAAFVEEWGLVGALLVIICFILIIFELCKRAEQASSNFEAFFMLGLSCILLAHFLFHIGINIGLLPATGITLPFMSYGGSHLITTYAGLGLVVAMSQAKRLRSGSREIFD